MARTGRRAFDDDRASDGRGDADADELPDHVGRSSAELLPEVYARLRRMAQAYISRERPGHTLQATALVHEAFDRVGEPTGGGWRSSRSFCLAVGEAMRRILVEHARARSRLKRGGDGQRPAIQLALDDLGGVPDEAGPDERDARLLALDEALSRLDREDDRAADVVRLRYFAGLTIGETATALGVSASTVDREWAFARARLHRLMIEATTDDEG